MNITRSQIVTRLGALLAGLVVVTTGLALAGQRPAGCPALTHLLLEFAGAERAQEAYACWDGAEVSLATALAWDTLLLIPAYVVVLAWWSAVSARLARTSRARTLATAGIWSAVLAGLFDLAENLSLWRLDRSGGADAGAAERALAFTLPKWTLVAVAVAIGVQGIVRALSALRRGPADLHLFEPRGATAWERNTQLPHHGEGGSNTGPPRGVGVSLSGGGIRSATFSMGALQSLQAAAVTGPDGTLDDVRYIAAVSGGGYMAGARQIVAAQQHLREPFAAGSLEEEFVRRHGRYLADGLLEWLTLLTRIVVGVGLNLTVLVGMLFVVALPVGWGQRSLVFRGQEPPFAATGGMWAGVLAPLGLAALVFVAVLLLPIGSRPGVLVGTRLFSVAAVAAVAGIAVFAVVAFLPWLSDAAARYTQDGGDALVQAAGGSGVSAIAAWLAFRGPGRKRLARYLARIDAEHPPSGTDDVTQPPTFVQRLRVARWLPGVLLALVALYLFAWFAHRGSVRGPRAAEAFGFFPVADGWVWLAAVGLLALLYVGADQTSWSLHGFYKRRLAAAFTPGITGDDEEMEELPYHVPTALDVVGADRRGPKLVLCAAANLSGRQAPPGRRALSFTFEHDWVGGPEIGYMTPHTLRRALGRRNEGDSTLLAAMAISGAAIASAMGRHHLGTLNAVLATFNVRLGVWLPSPRYLAEVRDGLAPPPGWRRFGYLLNEILGSYDISDRFLYTSDGGHVENLGLVELLRRRCETILCFDASGGPRTLLEAVRLADETLGVKVTFDRGAYASVREGSAPDHGTSPAAVRARMASTDVIVGTVRYPGLGADHPAGEGKLIYARAVLTSQTSDEVLEHASRNPRFPNDSTGDQWFDVERFNSYLRLGREVAERALQHV